MLENIIERFDSKIDFLTSRPIIIIPILLLIGFVLRVYFTPFDLPSRSSDALVFLINALAFHNSFEYVGGPYFMWSGLLAIIFSAFQFENYEGYFNIIRITSILISCVSSIVLFLIAKQIMNKKYAMFAIALFIFDPNLIENAIFGLTEPLFILLGLLSVYFLFQKNPKLILLAFIFAALAADTRSTGLILLPIAIFGVYFRSSKKEFLKIIIIGVSIFIILYMPVIVYNEGLPHDNLMNLTSESKEFSSEEINFSENKFLVAGITEITHIFRILLPYLILFAPIGFFVSIYKINWKVKIMTLIIVFQFIIAIPQYTESVTFRNLFFLTPIFSLFGALGLEYFSNGKKLRNILLICIIFGLILTSYYFLNERQPDPNYILEQERFGKYVTKELKGTVVTADWNFIAHNIKYSIDSIPPQKLDGELNYLVAPFNINNENQLIEYLSKNKVDYVITNDKKFKRFEISQEIYFNEEKFVYLNKIFDSDEFNYKEYRTKIFELNHEKLE